MPAQPTHAALGTSGPFYGGSGRGCNLDILKVGDEQKGRGPTWSAMGRSMRE
jgi:hypothetical protein